MTRIFIALLLLPLPLLAGEGEKPDSDRAQRRFAERDADGDGKLTQAELGVPDRAFEFLDADQDGFVTQAELAAAAKKRGRGGGPQGEARGSEFVERKVEGILKRFDKDGDGRLAHAEMPSRGGVDFSKADRNGDGFVDRTELTAVLVERRSRADRQPGGGGFSPEGIKRMLKNLEQMDSNGDGRIEKSEWKGREEIFARLDRDGDGAVTREELKEASKAMRGYRGRAGDALFRRADKDGDGRISLDEWPLEKEFFGRFDTNGDGFITREEVMAKGPRKRRGRNAERSGRDSAHFLGQYDRDGDGRVTRQEFPHERRFREMDTNSDGVLVAEEIEEAMDRRDAESGYGFLDRFDLDNDGKVTREEFTGPARVFERHDLNHDGVIDKQDEPVRGAK